MSDEQKKETPQTDSAADKAVATEAQPAAPATEASAPAKAPADKQRSGRNDRNDRSDRKGRGGNRRRRPRRGQEEKDEFEQKTIDLARVTRVVKGGKRMRFRACIVIGDRAGRVGMGLAKGQDVSTAMNKAVNQAKKNLVTVPFDNETILFEVTEQFKAAKVLLKPAGTGRGIIAGGAVRSVLELAGVPNVVAKILGTNNKVSNVRATMAALQRFSDWQATKGVKKSKSKKKADSADKQVSVTADTNQQTDKKVADKKTK